LVDDGFNGPSAVGRARPFPRHYAHFAILAAWWRCIRTAHLTGVGTMRNRHVFCVAIAFAAVLFSAEGAAATEYYVSASGSDSNNGTLDAPFLTIQKAAGLTNPGDIVYVTNGTYGPLSITRSGSASGGYIAYQAYPGHHPRINKTGDSWSAVQLKKENGASYIIIDGFNIVGNAEKITVNQAQTAVNYSNVTNGNCIGTGDKSNHIIIRNNHISYCPGGGIVATGDYLYIFNNVIHHNSFWSPLGTSGITVSGTDSDSSAATKIFVHDNVLYNNQNFICNRFQTNPCRITDGEGIIVDSNKASHFGGRVLLFNNISYNNGGPGIEVFQSQHVDVLNNTTYMNNISAKELSPFKAHTGGGEIAISQSTDVNVLNNIMYGGPYAPMIYQGSTSVTKLLWDYNIMFNGVDAKPMGEHDLVLDPLFVKPVAFDFHLQAGSPAVGSGTSKLAPREDFAGRPRPAGKVDRGAYQFKD